MADSRLLLDIDVTGRVLVSAWLDGELHAAPGEAAELAWPFGTEEMEDLRWYLEDYLQTPFGVYEDRGSRVADRIAAWGQAMFAALFGASPGREAYASIRRTGSAEIVLRSAAPAWLGLPWELLRDPRASAPLVLDGVGLSRGLPTVPLNGSVEVAGDQLRVLMVISRPAGTGDVGYQMIARPLLRSLQTMRGRVDLTVLRPPTFEALAERLCEARETGSPFQIVHFDGHGLLTGDQATLAFEKLSGGPDHVTADRIARVLAEAEVQVVVLNACQSGAVGKDLEAAMATGLLSAGVLAVVAMAYRVYAVAAAEFMMAFYERLFAGDRVSEAVRAGRSRMAEHPERPSPKGELPLEDWAVPVLYRHGDVRFPQLRADLRTRAAEASDDLLAPEDEFVGRDDVFCALEETTRTDRVVVLYGPGGTGKTEIARAFGRWWRDSGGVDHPDWVIWHSFEPGIASSGLDGVVLETGTRVYGPDFALHDSGTRRAQVMNLLREHRVLMIWDNFEPVASMPDPAVPQLDESAQNELKDFLHQLAATGRSIILVTSRTPEDWLGDVRRITVGGLHPDEAIEYAGRLLAPFPAAQARRADRSFPELLEWLDGHPLSMRLMLPHLETAEPAVLLAQLRGADPLPAADSDGRTTSLAGSIAYSIVHLDPASQRLLTALSLFHGVTDPGVLSRFSALEETPERFRGVTAEGWTALLDRAVHLGLLTRQAAGSYGIHPALPGYLAARWGTEEPGAYETATQALVTAFSATVEFVGRQLDTETAAQAHDYIDRNRRTLGHLLGYALNHRLWAQAMPVFIPLIQYLERRGFYQEARDWTARARLALEGPGGTPPLMTHPGSPLWAVAVLAQGNMLTRAGGLDAAEAAYREILQVAEAAPEIPAMRPILAIVYGKLGFAAETRGQPDEAEQWSRQALAIYQELGDRDGIAQMIRHLGNVARAQGRWDEAGEYYHRSLSLKKELGDVHGTALAYDRLGDLAEERGRLEEAERWYDESRCISEERADWDGVARSIHSLAMVARKRGQLDQAEQRYRESLTLAEKARDRPGMAASYHELGIIALQRGQDESEQWFRQSLAINQDLRNRRGMAKDYRMLGLIAHARGQLDEAERLYRQSLTIEQDMDHQLAVMVSWLQLAMLAEARGRLEDALDRVIQYTALSQRFPHVAGRREHILLLARLAGKLGMQALEQRWEQVTGTSLPAALRESLLQNENDPAEDE